jgi:site-specific DNA-methyltransferase (adenine-specific)
MEVNKILQGDCLEVMPNIPDKSIDMILCDLPYGALNKNNPNAKWDIVIPFEPLWKEYKRIIKDNGAIVLTAQGMFSAKLMLSNKKMWKYNLVWKKSNRISGFLNSNRMPLRNHEDIIVFYNKLPTYNPQMTKGEKSHTRGHGKNLKNGCYGEHKFIQGTEYTTNKFPISVLNFDKDHPPIHPTQKPVALFEYLIKTYTNKGDLVLDNCAGSGTTGVACKNLGRDFILIEKEKKYYEIAKKRINVTSEPLF